VCLRVGVIYYNNQTFDASKKLAEYWESYLTNVNPKIPSGVRALFDWLAAAIRQIFKEMGWKREDVPKELRKIFDDMAAGRARISHCLCC
jgi:hypothetical protein